MASGFWFIDCFILGASSVIPKENNVTGAVGNSSDNNGSIPESFYTNGGLKLRVVWTISSLIAASARHYLLQPIIAEHQTLTSLVLTDADGQGIVCMNKDQLEELRVKQWKMSFVMPSKYVANLPLPKDSSVRIQEVPKKIVAVAAFSGFVTDREVKRQEVKLRDALRSDMQFKGKEGALVEVAQYNPPFTRRNEIALEVEPALNGSKTRGLTCTNIKCLIPNSTH